KTTMAATGGKIRWDEEDSRLKCKYGSDCYQNNKAHHMKYKHPLKRKAEADSDVPVKAKKAKIDDYFNKNSKANEDGEEDLEAMQEERTSKAKDDLGEVHVQEEKSSGYVRQVSDDDAATTEDLDEPPSSPTNIKESLKQKFLVDFPDDFFSFWEFCKALNPKHPEDALKGLDLKLVGPYDIIAEKHKQFKGTPNYLLHWRFYYDPPEFQTVVFNEKDESLFHLGYFRDDPKEEPVFVASNCASVNGVITPRGENLFAAIKWYIDDKQKKNKKKENKDLCNISASLKKWADKNNFSLDLKTKSMKQRDKKVVCSSFHKAGIVVPVENDIGYREVPETPGDLKKIFAKIEKSQSEEERDKNMDPLQELITLVQFANDECDYGEGLELGMDLFTYGGDVFHGPIMTLLPLAYQFLGRLENMQIITAHIADRKKGQNVDQLR
ncbi:unnamed protein product, partial [Owenia fusiformis]